MKRIIVFLIVVMVLSVSGTAWSQGLTRINPGELDRASQNALMALDLAKGGADLSGIPYFRVTPSTRMSFMAKIPPGYSRVDRAVYKFDQTQMGVRTLEQVDKYEDSQGNSMATFSSIMFTVLRPKAGEVEATKGSLLAAMQDVEKLDKGLANDTRSMVSKFQKINGLPADGMFGPGTARELAQQIDIIDIHEMRSSPANTGGGAASAAPASYTDNPRVEILVLPAAMVEANPAMYNNGFASLDAVRTNALSPGTFQAQANRGSEFYMFAFFHDYVDPTKDLRIGFSSREKKKERRSMTDERYALAGQRPVLMEKVKISGKLGKKVYANVFLDDEYVAGIKLK